MVIRASKNNQFEPETFNYILLELEPKSLFVDVGAYTGIYSLFVSKFKYAKVLAFEPNPNCYRRFIDNMDLMDQPLNIQLYDCALDRCSSLLPFYVNPNLEFTQGGSLIKSGTRTERYDVETMTLDEMNLSDVDMIKIDVEENELNVIVGMYETIRRCRPKIIVECLSIDAIKNIDNLMLDINYERICILDQRNCVYEPRG